MCRVLPLVCLSVSLFVFSPSCCRWTMWRKTAVCRTPRLCWCPRRERGCSTPRPTVSSPSRLTRPTAASTRTNPTTTSGWHAFSQKLLHFTLIHIHMWSNTCQRRVERVLFLLTLTQEVGQCSQQWQRQMCVCLITVLAAKTQIRFFKFYSCVFG